MKKALVLTITVAAAAAAAAVLLAGCGSKNTAVEELRAEQKRGLERLNEQVRALSAEMLRMREDIRELDGDLFDFKNQLDMGVASARDGGETTAAAGTGGGTTSAAGAVEEVPVKPIEANVEVLATELAKLRQEYHNDKELAMLRDPRKTWQAMGDAEKLSWRLDRFARKHAGTIEDEATREQFLADIESLKDGAKTRASEPREEQVERYTAKLTERISTETNERRRQWHERQLTAFTSGDENAINNQLDRALRHDNARDVREFAQKYKISNEELRNNGLVSYGLMSYGSGSTVTVELH
jgi:outer membrane murein-binding lipoprotein Lpp